MKVCRSYIHLSPYSFGSLVNTLIATNKLYGKKFGDYFLFRRRLVDMEDHVDNPPLREAQGKRELKRRSEMAGLAPGHGG